VVADSETAVAPLHWSSETEADGNIALLCDDCTRANLRAIEAKLADGWWA
jgi:hypothetical protein